MNKNVNVLKNNYASAKTVEIANLNKNLKAKKPSYSVVIKSFDIELLDEVADFILSYQKWYYEPFLYERSSLMQILQYDLPFAFFLNLDENQSLEFKKIMRSYEQFEIKNVMFLNNERSYMIVIRYDNKKLADSELDEKKVVDYLHDFYLALFELYKFKKKASNLALSRTNFKDFLVNYANKDLVIWNHSDLSDCIYLITQFNIHFPLLPFNFYIQPTKLLLEKNKFYEFD